jgi:hypothetical protein
LGLQWLKKSSFFFTKKDATLIFSHHYDNLNLDVFFHIKKIKPSPSMQGWA